MSLVWFTDAQTENKVAINPAHVVAVFTAIEGPMEGKTIISALNGSIPVQEDVLSAVSAMNGDS